MLYRRSRCSHEQARPAPERAPSAPFACLQRWRCALSSVASQGAERRARLCNWLVARACAQLLPRACHASLTTASLRSAVGRRVAAQLHATFLDADDQHSQAAKGANLRTGSGLHLRCCSRGRLQPPWRAGTH